MSDIDEGERDGDRAHDGTTRDLRMSLYSREIPPDPYVWKLLDLIDAQQAAITSLRERLETYMTRSAPALSAARMHVPIGGGSYWERRDNEQRRKQREEAKERYRLALAARTPEKVAADNAAFEALFQKPKAKRVQRKRVSKKIIRRK